MTDMNRIRKEYEKAASRKQELTESLRQTEKTDPTNLNQIWILRDQIAYWEMYKKILLAYDGSKGAGRALDAALNLAKLHGAELWVLAVEESLPRFAATMDEVQEEKEFANRYYGQLLEEAGKKAREAGVELHPLLRAGHAAKTIVEAAREGAFDLVIVGHTGHSEVWARFLGTTAEKVSRHVPCSVLIVR